MTIIAALPRDVVRYKDGALRLDTGRAYRRTTNEHGGVAVRCMLSVYMFVPTHSNSSRTGQYLGRALLCRCYMPRETPKADIDAKLRAMCVEVALHHNTTFRLIGKSK